MRPLIIATHNSRKTAEIAAIVGSRFSVSDLRDHAEIAPAEETGTTFAENAQIKAWAAARSCSGLIVGEDSGLEVDLLDGEPGIFSARYAGPAASDAANRARLLAELEARAGPAEPRTARFRCVMVLVHSGEVRAVCDGLVEGTIARAERGSGGFGYDSLFIPAGYAQTFAELSAEIKNRISHRAVALARLREYLMRE